MSQSWLNKQRKQTLIDLSAEAGLQQQDNLLKDEIVEALHEHLQANASSLSSNPSFEGYYGTRRTPFKPRPSLAPADTSASGSTEPELKSVVKARGKRATKVKQEEESLSSPTATLKSAIKTLIPSPPPTIVPAALASSPSSPTQALATSSTAAATTTTATPAPRRRRSEVPGPASPSEVADIVEHSSAQLAASARNLYTASGITETISSLREACSSVTGIQLTVLTLEFLSLQYSLIPFRYLGELPGFSLPVYYPDLFILLTGEYWAPTLLWAATALVVPGVLAYFYNLGIKRVKRGERRVIVAAYEADPLALNVVKALATWSVHVRGEGFGGLVSRDVAERVEGAMLGGSTGVLIGCGIGGIAAVYEAALKRGA